MEYQASSDRLCMKNMEISPREREYLIEILQENLGQLREEVYHFETAEFQDELKAKKELVQDLLERLMEMESGVASAR